MKLANKKTVFWAVFFSAMIIKFICYNKVNLLVIKNNYEKGVGNGQTESS